MENNDVPKRPPGRPRAFDPVEALDRAVELFWQYGYEGVDVERIARAVNITKPALYREFGDKATLLFKAVTRYAETYGAPMLKAFLEEPDIRKAVSGFCESTVLTATSDPRVGCLMASAALGQSERVAEIRAYFALGLLASADILARRFDAEIKAKRLSNRLSGTVRGRVLVDIMQGLLLRARTGIPQAQLIADARSYVQVVLD